MSNQLSFMAIAHDDKDQDWGLIERTIIELNPPTVGVMLSLKKAVDLSHKIKGTVLYSRWHGDGPFWTTYPARDYIEMMKSWKNEGFHEGMIVDAFRENVGGHVDGFVDYNVDLANRATDAGIRLALGGFSTGGYEIQDILDGKYDALIKVWCEGNHVLSVHEYTGFGAHTGLGTMPDGFITERFDPQKDPWGLDEPHQFTPGIMFRNHPSLWADPAEQLNSFLYRRVTAFHDRAEAMGLVPGEVISTESNIAEQIDSYNNARAILERDIGVAMRDDGSSPYLTLRGPFTMKKVWAEWWGSHKGKNWDGTDLAGWSWEDALIQQLKYLDKIYEHARFKVNGYHLFVLEGVWSAWDVKYGFDYVRYPAVLERIVETFKAGKPVESPTDKPPVIDSKPEPDTKTVWITSKGIFANIREEPRITGKDVGDFTKRPMQVEIKNPPTVTLSDGYEWLSFYLNGRELFVAKSVVHISDSPDAKPQVKKYDMAKYLFANPDTTFQLDNTWGGGEILYGLVEGTRFRKVKNGNWEGFRVTEEFIFRDMDTSPGPYEGRDRYYLVKREDGQLGIEWLPRYMAVGDSYVSRSHVEHRFKDNDELIQRYSGPLPVRLVLKAHHVTFEADNGHKFTDVLEVWGYLGNGPNVTEKWWCHRGYGYFIQWQEIAPDGKVKKTAYFGGQVDASKRMPPEHYPQYDKLLNWNPPGALRIEDAMREKPETVVEPPIQPQPKPDTMPLFLELALIEGGINDLTARLSDLQREIAELKKAS